MLGGNAMGTPLRIEARASADDPDQFRSGEKIRETMRCPEVRT